MLQSTIHKMKDGKDVVVGMIGCQGGNLFVRPDDELLHSICDDPILDENSQPVDASNAAAFVKNLYLTYKSGYLRAEEATEENEDAE